MWCQTLTVCMLLLSHNLYSGAKHIPLTSRRPFHFQCSIGALFHSNQTNTIQPQINNKIALENTLNFLKKLHIKNLAKLFKYFRLFEYLSSSYCPLKQLLEGKVFLWNLLKSGCDKKRCLQLNKKNAVIDVDGQRWPNTKNAFLNSEKM